MARYACLRVDLLQELVKGLAPIEFSKLARRLPLRTWNRATISVGGRSTVGCDSIVETEIDPELREAARTWLAVTPLRSDSDW